MKYRLWEFVDCGIKLSEVITYALALNLYKYRL